MSFNIFPRRRVGLVGPNGSGKTTLLRIIDGQIRPSSGNLRVKGDTIYVSQVNLKDMQSLRINSAFKVIAGRFGIEINSDTDFELLSGGEKLMLNIAQALVENPDILLLDEPTNHLDIISRKNLIEVLNEFPNTLIIASHDIGLLDQVTDQTLYIEYGKVYQLENPYTKALVELEDIHEETLAKFKKEDKELVRLDRTYHGYLDKIRDRQAKVRIIEKRGEASIDFFNASTDYKEEFQQYIEDEDSVSQLKTTDYTADDYGSFSINDGVMGINEDEVLIEDINLDIKSSNRVSILGRNGVGKSMFMKSVLQKAYGIDKLPGFLEGKFDCEEIGKFAFIDQSYKIVDGEKSMIENLKASSPGLSRNNQQFHLKQVGFDKPIQWNRRAIHLSGGELARLAIAMATTKMQKMLFLDEPTNNLDIDTVKIITRKLNEFKGTLIVISHDLHFLSRLNINNSLVIKDKKIKKLELFDYDSENLYEQVANLI